MHNFISHVPEQRSSCCFPEKIKLYTVIHCRPIVIGVSLAGFNTVFLFHRNGQSSEDCFCDLSVVVRSDGRIQTRPG